MKKLLLSAMFACGAFFAGAQTCTTSGISSTGVYDDFSSATAPTSGTMGLYEYAGSGAGFNATLNRNATSGMFEVTMTQPKGSYVPVGFSFGTAASGARNVIDLSGNKTFSVTFKNTQTSATDSSMIFRFVIVDSLGRQIDTYAAAGAAAPAGGAGNCDNAWQYGIATAGTAPNTAVTLSGTFAGGYWADYTKAAPQCASTSGANCFLNCTFDFTIVTNISITVVNPNQDVNAGYAPYALNGKTWAIDKLRLGACPSTTGLTSPAVSNAAMTITPNPATSEVLVSYSGSSSNVTFNVTDVTGKVVKSVAGNGSTANINVSDLSKGMYFVTTVSNNAPVSVSKLVVE